MLGARYRARPRGDTVFGGVRRGRDALDCGDDKGAVRVRRCTLSCHRRCLCLWPPATILVTPTARGRVMTSCSGMDVPCSRPPARESGEANRALLPTDRDSVCRGSAEARARRNQRQDAERMDPKHVWVQSWVLIASTPNHVPVPRAHSPM